MDLNNFKLDKQYLQKIDSNIVYNKTIINYYKILYSETNLNCIKNTIDNIYNCNKIWNFDSYNDLMIRDFLSTSLCKNKFCNNCKKVKQATRMSKYIPALENYSDNMYHLVLTLPSVTSSDLSDTIKKMSRCFRDLIRFINCTKSFSSYNFSSLNYLGAIRSLEITFKDDLYHPHYHCALIFNNCNLNKIYTNKFSYSNRSSDITFFSDLEIVIQKIWFLLLNDIPCTKKNINNLITGYSCKLDKFNNNDYAELFKYMTKETNENDNILSYSNFKTLFWSTRNIKQIQGYGCLYRINDSDLDSEVDLVYLDILDSLITNSSRSLFSSSVRSVLLDNDFTYISRKKIYEYLRNIK